MSEEQKAFEAWATEHRYDMHQHPLHYLFLDQKTNAARKGWNAALRYAEGEASSPVAYRCKDFADGWVLFQDAVEANQYQQRTGCLIQPLRISTKTDDEHVFPPEPETACREASDIVIAALNGGLSKLVAESGMMGLNDTIRAATGRIRDLTSSYLDACAENDRLRASIAASEPTNPPALSE